MRWAFGDIPDNETHWEFLQSKKISTVFNFSSVQLQRISGFHIINFPSMLPSIVMPMTESENQNVDEFKFILHSICNVSNLYICGHINDCVIIATILRNKKHINIRLPDVHIEPMGMYLIEQHNI